MYITNLFPCSPEPPRENIKHAFSWYINRDHDKENTFVTQTVYLLNLGTHSFFQILYTLLLSLRISILLRSSFFSFLIFWFQVCFSLFTQIDTSFLAITLQVLLSDHSSVTFPPLPLLCSALYMFSLAFVYLENFLHHSWIKLFKSFTINNLNEKRTFNKIKIIGLRKGEYLECSTVDKKLAKLQQLRLQGYK